MGGAPFSVNTILNIGRTEALPSTPKISIRPSRSRSPIAISRPFSGVLRVRSDGGFQSKGNSIRVCFLSNPDGFGLEPETKPRRFVKRTSSATSACVLRCRTRTRSWCAWPCVLSTMEKSRHDPQEKRKRKPARCERMRRNRRRKSRRSGRRADRWNASTCRNTSTIEALRWSLSMHSPGDLDGPR